jgi:hypothetical protein
MATTSNKNERSYYASIKEWLEQILKEKFASYHLEITADKKFSNVLKAQIDRNRDLIFNFLKEAPPDITGFVKGEYSREFIVAEVKKQPIKLDDIYQTRKYAELFDARYALLVSTEEIPEEIMRLSKVCFPDLLSLPAYKRLTLVHFADNGKSSVWFEENPFMKLKNKGMT